MMVFVLQRELRRGRWAFKELKAAQARLQDMTESSFDWAWETDADLRYAYISGQVAGASPSEQNSYIGKTRLRCRSHPRSRWLERHAEDMAARRPFTFRPGSR
jgi:PAS domain-containing protein